ncbi:MAG: hypothetical protein AAFR59_13595, partial [Bacteroidota bacterium]
KQGFIPTFSLITNRIPMQQRIILLICLGVFLWACNSSSQEDSAPSTQETSVASSNSSANAHQRQASEQSRSVAPAQEAAPLSVKDVSQVVLTALKDKDWNTVADHVHSGLGVCFTPEVYVSEKDQILQADQLRSAAFRDQKRNWGNVYGEESDTERLMTLDEYYDAYIMDVDFTQAAEVNFDQDVQRGNSINNARTAFEKPYIVEYYIPGINPDFGGMDWRALRLIFAEDGDKWGLVGIIHAEWTP